MTTGRDVGFALLPPNQFDHFYRGGDRIAALRGGPGGPMRPEEWIASTVTRFGQHRSGLSSLPDGRLLRDAVDSAPRDWLGPAHVAAFGASTEVLVKLLDPDQRLPVHFHPDRAFAREHLALDRGKTEAWVILEAPPGAAVGLGFAEPTRRQEVLDLVARREAAALLASLDRRPVAAGDGILVPAGVPHSIDAGLLLLEVQEPTDLSVLLEWEGLAVDGVRDGHLGLGFPEALGALRLTPLSGHELDRLVCPAGPRAGVMRSLLPAAADPYFRVDELPDGGWVDPGFSVALVLDGAGEISSEYGGEVRIRRGDALVVPWAVGSWRTEGAHVVICRPPLPGVAKGAR